MFKELIIFNKNRIRRKHYMNYRDFFCKKDYLFSHTNLMWYDGNYNIPKHSTFYNDILIKNNIDILDEKSVVRFLLSKEGKYQLSSTYTKMYIVPVRKYLNKYKVFNKRLFKLLVFVKVFDPEQFYRLIKIKDPTYSKMLFYLQM